jgi:hypothetical protein
MFEFLPHSGDQLFTLLPHSAEGNYANAAQYELAE